MVFKSIEEAASAPKARVFRRAFIKRRSLTTGLYESDWQEITDDVKRWGSVRMTADSDRQGKLTLDSVRLTMHNDFGRYNPSDDPNSLWYGYMNQQRSLIKIDAGFVSSTQGADGIWYHAYLPSYNYWDQAFWDQAFWDIEHSTQVFIGIVSGEMVLSSNNEVLIQAKPLTQVFKDYPASNLTSLGSNAYGPELITTQADRDFSSVGGGWSVGSLWTITGGVLAHTVGALGVTMTSGALSSPPENGKVYRITATIVTSILGSLIPSFGGVSGEALGTATGTASMDQLFYATTSNALGFTPNEGWVGHIDDLSIKEVVMTGSRFMELLRDQTDGSNNYIFRQFFGDTTSNWDIATTTAVFASLNTTTSKDVRDKTCWDIIEKLAEAEQHLAFADQTGVFRYIPNTADSTVSFQFHGLGSFDSTYGHTIKSIQRFGKDFPKFYSRVQVRFREEDTVTSYYTRESTFQVSAQNTAWELGHRTFNIENFWIPNSATAVTIAETVFEELSSLNNVIEFTASFVPHLTPLDRISLHYDSTSRPHEETLWDVNDWDTELTWDYSRGDAIVLGGQEYKILSIDINLDNFETKLIAREI